MYFDGSLKLEGVGAGVLLISPTGEQLKYVLQIFWKVSKNEAKYDALLHGLRLAASLGIKRLLVYGDSAVVINQVNKSWDRNKENMDAYCLEVLGGLSYGPPWAHCLGGYQDRLLGGPLGLLSLCHTAPDDVRRKDFGGEVLE
jgi:hypothetical protein